MCTVSVIKLSGLLRLVSNRDERRTRPTALPPAVSHAGGLRIIAPTDPASQGTWIACSEIGLAIALLNVNPPDADARVPPRSRGTIIPTLIGSRSLDEVAERAGAIEHGDYAPYRLVAIHAGEDDVIEAVPMSGVLRRWPLDAPRMFTSSGLGDHHVEGPRRQLFEETVLPGDPADWREQTGSISRAPLARPPVGERAHGACRSVDGQPDRHRDRRRAHRDVIRGGTGLDHGGDDRGSRVLGLARRQQQ